MEIKKYEQYVIKKFGILRVNFEGLNIDVVKEIIIALDEVINKFPILKDTICSISNEEEINNEWSMYVYSDKTNYSEALKNNKFEYYEVDYTQGGIFLTAPNYYAMEISCFSKSYKVFTLILGWGITI